MLKDNYDKILWALLIVTLGSLAFLLSGQWMISQSDQLAAGSDKALQRQMANLARVSLLQNIYEPVEALKRSGNLQKALFKLDEIDRTYLNEAHGRILKADILYQMGAVEEALASYVAGVRSNGDYVDRNSLLSRRDQIQEVVDEAARVVAVRTRANPDNQSLITTLKNVYYLRGRLAGGCE
jgi:tetratricopeptide (TPR) repeat protein